jgi:hypothetical protein
MRQIHGHDLLDHPWCYCRFIGSKIVDKQGQGFWLNIAFGSPLA